MALSILLFAVFSGFVASGIWLLSGGSLLAAVGVYLLTGQLVTLAMVAQLIFGKSNED